MDFSHRIDFIMLLSFLVLSCGNSLGKGDARIPAKRTGERIDVEVFRGERVTDLCGRLEKSNIATHASFLAIAKHAIFSGYEAVPPPSESISRFEGLFVPGKYYFESDRIRYIRFAKNKEAQAVVNAKAIVQTLLRASDTRLRSITSVRGFTPYEVVILASIVEKEAAGKKDHAVVASVFYNRLSGGGRMSSCPTVEYGLGYHRPFLTLEDIAVESPYNVYRNKGLPPTPICFFSDHALEGAMYPRETDYYYFVFDWTTGDLAFASKYDSHVKNAARARSNFIKARGESSMWKIRHDKFYED